MSEPLSSVEIEDVLSSIRRLVSEDLRPAARHPGAGAGDKLILTPALRVVADAEIPVEYSRETADRPADPHHESPNEADGSTLQAAASLEVAVGALAEVQEWESETGDLAPMAGIDWSSGDLARFEDMAQDHEIEEVPADERGEIIETVVMEEIELAELVADADDFSPGWAQDDIDEPETMTGTAAMAGPVAAPVAEDAPVDPVWAAQAEAEVIAALSDIGGAGGSGLFTEPGEVSFDEEVLRGLVRDLIREELQGGLGERITRNVRKLVRAEIARALAAQALQ